MGTTALLSVNLGTHTVRLRDDTGNEVEVEGAKLQLQFQQQQLSRCYCSPKHVT